MSPEEIIYLSVLLVSIPIGFLFKKGGLKTKQFGGAAAGLVLTLATCHIHTLHSLITILGTWLIINISPRACHYLTLGWTFSYLLFFRTVTFFDFPEPTPFTNAVQLLLTLKMVSLANEVQEFTQAKKQEVTSFSKSSVIGVIPKMPGLVEILCYSFCYVGLMTGTSSGGYKSIPVLFFTFLISRSADGEASEVTYDYETIKNIDPHGTDFCVKVKDGMRYWNMSVQWWLAQYIYKNAPVRSYVMRSAWTMLISAYWHGIHPGYYLSFLTIPLCLAAEGAMESGLLKHLSASQRLFGDWVQWFLKMRAYDYMCMGFVLLTFEDTVRYWSSIYFCIHGAALAFLLLGKVLGFRRQQASQKDKDGAVESLQHME
nr:PREDICTED: lysophospholipid acyltransferase 7 [Anolis carolinensis]|eukprot:XP_016851537.1 PREDICTED: lysophospholipid acyltransferase 7 [Anolis carolinensis]